MTDTRLTEAELAELLRLLAKATAQPWKAELHRVHGRINAEFIYRAEGMRCQVARIMGSKPDGEAIVALINAAPRLIAAARLANEQAERIAELVSEREKVAAGLRMWNETLAAQRQQLADRDATIQRLESECDSLRRRWHDLERIQDRQLTFDSVAMELADSEEKRRQADATIERLTAERDAARRELKRYHDAASVCDAGLDSLEERADARLDEHPASPLADILSDVLLNARQRKRDCEVLRSERDAARDRLAKAKGLADRARNALRSLDAYATARLIVALDEWDAERAELDR